MAHRSPVGLVLVLLAIVAFGYIARPTIAPGYLPGGDAQEYAHLAQSLLHGSYLVDYDGPPRPTRYTPGFSILLMPAVSVGGLESAVWVSYAAALVVGALAGLIAFGVGGGTAALLATLLVLFNVGMFVAAQIIMSDVVSAAIALGEVALLAFVVSRKSAIAAGLLGGALVWIRPGALVLTLAAAAGLWRAQLGTKRLLFYALGLIGPLLLLGVWQWTVFGSPFITSYQATGAGTSGSGSELGSFFSFRYVFGPPWNTYSVGTDPNLLVYLLALVGFDTPYTYPFIGLIGIIGAVFLARRPGPAGVVGRFTLATTAVTLLLYVPYFFRDLRFLLIPVELNHISAAIVLAEGLARARRLFDKRTMRNTLVAEQRAGIGPHR